MEDRPSARDLLRCSPSPAMMPERIGIIGSMQGVKASSSPSTRKPPSTSARLPCIDRAGGKAERLLGVEQIGGAGAMSADQQREEEEECFQALVSAATQSR